MLQLDCPCFLCQVRKQQQQQKVVVQNLVALEMEIKDVLEILGLLPYPSTLEVYWLSAIESVFNNIVFFHYMNHLVHLCTMLTVPVMLNFLA